MGILQGNVQVMLSFVRQGNLLATVVEGNQQDSQFAVRDWLKVSLLMKLYWRLAVLGL